MWESKAVFAVSVHDKKFDVWVTSRGGIGDSCVEELAVAQDDLCAAYRAVLHHILQDWSMAKACGIDPELLELLWV